MITQMQDYEAKNVSYLHGLCFLKAWSEKDFLEFYHNKNIIVLLFKQDEEVISMMVAQIIAPQAEIYTFCTHPAFRGQNIASQLMDYFKNFLIENNYDEIFLEVSENNKIAQKFYENSDFKIYDRRKNYYIEEHKQYDALLMKWIKG